MKSAELINRVRSGEAASLTEIIEAYQSPIARYLYRLTGDYETARDLAQDTFVKVLKNIDKTSSDLNLNAWIYRIATNTAMQYHRRKKIIGFITFETLKRQESEGTSKIPADPVEKLAIRETLQQLPYNQRICVVLYYVEGFKCREIAETLELSEAAVRKRIARGVKAFREVYNGGNEQ